jgi:hypothetical protein
MGKLETKADEFAFLGEEFLFWLWFCAETRGGMHAVADVNGQEARIGVALDRILEFYDATGGVRVAVRGDAPTRAPEAREALRRGMRLTRAGIVITSGDENVTLQLDGPTFDLKSLKGEKPEADTKEERDQAVLAMLFGCADSLERVYRAFLEERAAKTFESTLGREMRRWAKSEKVPKAARSERARVAADDDDE